MRKFRKLGLALLVSLLTACGGGGGGASGGSSISTAINTAASSSGGATGGVAPSTDPSSDVNVAHGRRVHRQEASRFLTQATFGATLSSIDALVASNLETWIEREFVKPQVSHLAHVEARAAARKADSDPLNDPNEPIDFYESFWRQAITSDDQLRQRAAFALSQIFVVSFDGDLSTNVRGIASFYDVLGRNAFGNFRTLLEDVSLHPAMGMYLSHLKNQKEDPSRGRVPDENYAREVMQLFTIGLYRLNQDGTRQLAGGAPIETYSNEDVSGLAKVFTGWSWAGPDKSDQRFFGDVRDPNRAVMPMQTYPKFHSLSEKRFLGTTIPTQSSADMEGDLRVALDTLFNHPNVGPFIGKQLIQRLVTSNPSPAYVQRVSDAFNSGRYNGMGSGQRGDMKSVLRAILLDPEAREAQFYTANSYGKLREPVVRMANWARAFRAQSVSGRFPIRDTEMQPTGQTPMRSPSVFNFYRPGYVPPATRAGALNLTVPEMQITHETSTASYLNRMQATIGSGIGLYNDVRADYVEEIALADNVAALVDRVDLLLTAGTMRQSTRHTIEGAVRAITIRSDTPGNTATDRGNRVKLAIMLAMASPEYIVQK